MVGISFEAAVTEQLQIRMHVLGNDYSATEFAGQELATIDLLSGGRLEFGIGAGWRRADFETLGIPWDRPVRIERLEEALALIEGLFGARAVQLLGPGLPHHELDGTPKPVQDRTRR